MKGRFEVRVLGATALFTAVLVFIAWWMGQHHDAFVQQVHEAQRVTVGVLPRFELPSLSWGEEAPRALAVMTPDAGFGADAGEPMQGTEAELAAILIPAICGPLYEACQCGGYPSIYAPEDERARATSCEQDALRDYRAWWRANIDGPVILQDPSVIAYLLEPLAPETCLENAASISLYLKSDAVDGEDCVEGTVCRDGSACEDGECVRYQREGEACLGDEELDRSHDPDDLAEHDCGAGLECVAHVCRVDPGAYFGSMYVLSVSEECGRTAFQSDSGCIPIGAPCTTNADCGEGYCEGESESRCIPDGPREECPPGECENTCPAGQWPGGPSDTCVPYAREGERCEEDACTPGTRCERFVTNGRCISYACAHAPLFSEPG